MAMNRKRDYKPGELERSERKRRRTESLLRSIAETRSSAAAPQSQPVERRGARPRYDWDAFWAEACRYVHFEGLPEKQADLEIYMKTWCLHEWGQEPATSSVRSKISKLYKALSDNP